MLLITENVLITFWSTMELILMLSGTLLYTKYISLRKLKMFLQASLTNKGSDNFRFHSYLCWLEIIVRWFCMSSVVVDICLLSPANEVWGKVCFHLRLSFSPLGGLCLWSHVPSREVSVQGGFCSGVLCPKGSVQGRSLSPSTVKSGRYASYWNAFLCSL